MTDANVTNTTATQEPGDLFVCEAERKCVLSHEVLASGDFPPSLISYLETSNSRAALCEKLILEEAEDFTTSCEDLMNLPTELNKNTLKLNQQDKENESASADTCLLPETEAPVTANVTAPPRKEDETETDDYGESEKHILCTSRLSEFSFTMEEIKENNEHQQAHKEKRHFEELKKEEQIRQRENDFQMELKKLMEAEKLHQIELQLMEKRAQERLDQEFLLQQELMSNLQKQVEEERRMMAEELKRMKEEEEKKRKEEEENRKKIEEEKIKRQKQKMEEEIRRKKMEEENREILEMRAEEERRLKEEQRKREEEEERRKREEVRIKMEEEKRKREEEDRKRREEEKREMQQRKMEEEMRRKKEEDRKITEVELRTKEEEKTKSEEEKGKVEEEMTKSKVETKSDECNKKIWLKEEKTSQMEQMERETNAKKMENKSNPKVQKEEEKAGKREEGKTVMKVTGKNIEGSKEKTNEDDIRHIKEWRKEEGKAGLKESERRDAEVTKELEARTRHEEEMKKKKPEDTMTTDEQMGKREEEEKQRIVDGTQLSEDRDKRRKNKVIRKEEEKIIQEEWRKRQEAEKEDHRNKEEEIRSNEEKEHKAKIRKDDRNITEKEKQEKKSEEGQKEEGSKIIRVQEETVTGSNDLQDNNPTNSRTETESPGGAGSSLSWTSLSWTSGLGAAVTEACVGQQVCSSSTSSPLGPPEQKRLRWMKDCVSWCKLSLQNRRKQKGPLRGGRLPRRPETSGLPPLCPDTLLQATGCRSFQQVTSVTLEDLPGCSVSSLALCSHLQCLTLRRCGLTSLEGISQLSQLCYIDVTENQISFVDCEDMTSLRVLRLGYNKLTSIHGLRGADNLDELELSHNNITRIAGLESMRRLQRLSVDHNQLISTKGLRDVYTLLHLNCSHNHLAGVEGLENNVLLKALDLRSNSLPEPPGLNNHVLLRELHLDDNSICSLQALAAAWLPLMQNLSVAQNRITRLPSMSDFVSLANLDLQFNCMSELHNVCESLKGCVFLQHVHLGGNPLQQENGWRSTLQKALPGLRAIDDQQTDCFLSPPAVQQISSASDTSLSFCQAQLQQMNDLLQQHSRELSQASSPLDAVKSLCRHFNETLKLAEDQRFAHEYGDVTASEGPTDTQSTAATKLIEDAQTESSETVPAVSPSRNNVNSSWTCETSPTESWLQSSDAGTKETGLDSLSEKRTTSSSDCQMAAVSDHDLDHKNSSAIVIQQQWRKCRHNQGDINWRPIAASGDGANSEPEPSCVIHSVVDQHNAAAVIQASWRGFSVRRRLASALAAVTFPSTREDDTFEEIDMDEFVFDEAELEKHWTLQLPDDSLCRREPVSEQPPSPELSLPLPEPSNNTHPSHPVWRPKQAWVPEAEVDPAGSDSPESSYRKSPASSSVLSGISERSEKILEEWGFTDSHTALQMLKRAQNMKWKQQRKKKHKGPSVGALFYQLVPVEAGNRAAPRSRNHRRGALCRTEQQPERTEPVNQESAQQRLHGQCDRRSESERFLPELRADVLNGGRVQLVADPVFSERHRASGQRANGASSAQQHSGYPPRISLGQATTDAPSPNRKERISFRDNVVQLSGGWGGGKKRSNK